MHSANHLCSIYNSIVADGYQVYNYCRYMQVMYPGCQRDTTAPNCQKNQIGLHSLHSHSLDT